MLSKDEELDIQLKQYLTNLCALTKSIASNKSYELLNNANIPFDDLGFIKSLFKLSLKNNEYLISMYLFLNMNSFPNKYFYIKFSEVPDCNRLKSLIEDVINIVGILNNYDGNHRCIKLLPELIDHIINSGSNLMNTPISVKGHMNFVLTTNICTIFYMVLGNQSDKLKIDDSENVETQFLKHFKPDYTQALYLAIHGGGQKEALSHLLKTNKVNVLEKTWFKMKCGQRCLGVDETLGQISPFQAILEHMCINKFNYSDNCFALRTFRMLIKYEPLCVKLCDRNTGENIFDKISYMKTFSIKEKDGAGLNDINETLAVINEAKLLIERKYTTFFQGAEDSGSNVSMLNKDILMGIGKHFI